jgi:hypothetical protein
MMRRALILSLIPALAAPIAAAAPPSIAEVLRSVPESASVVVAFDTAALREAPRVQEWLLHHQAWTGADTDLRRFLADAELDPVRDVDAMLVAVLHGGSGSEGIAFFPGRYDSTSLQAAIVKRGAEVFTIGGVPAYRLVDSDAHHGEPAVLAQPFPDLVIVGDEAAVRTALSGPHAVPALVAKELAAGHIDLRAPFWVVANVPEVTRARTADAAARLHGDGAEPVRGVLLASGTVQRVAVQAFLDNTLKLSGVALADTPENADLLRDAVKGAIAVARLHAEQASPELVNVLRDVEVRVSGAEVSVSGSLPLTLLDNLAAEHRAAHHPGAHDPVR